MPIDETSIPGFRFWTRLMQLKSGEILANVQLFNVGRGSASDIYIK